MTGIVTAFKALSLDAAERRGNAPWQAAQRNNLDGFVTMLAPSERSRMVGWKPGREGRRAFFEGDSHARIYAKQTSRALLL
jgi:hypothetical protein